METCEAHEEIVQLLHDRISKIRDKLFAGFWRVVAIFGVAAISAMVIFALKIGVMADEHDVTENAKQIAILIEISKEQSKNLDKVAKAIETVSQDLKTHVERDWKDHHKGESYGRDKN